MKFEITVKDNKLHCETPDKLKKFLSTLEGQKAVLEITKYKPLRSLNQNAYYHSAYVNELVNYTGESHERVHAVLKELYLPKRTILFNGKNVVVNGSTKLLNKSEFTEYLMRIDAEFPEVHFATPQELGFIISNR